MPVGFGKPASWGNQRSVSKRRVVLRSLEQRWERKPIAQAKAEAALTASEAGLSPLPARDVPETGASISAWNGHWAGWTIAPRPDPCGVLLHAVSRFALPRARRAWA